MIEENIIKQLKSAPAQHNKALSYLYQSDKLKRPIIIFLRSKGMSKDECNILWTDIVVKFALLVRNNKYVHQGKLLGYLKNLANYMLLNYIRSRSKSKYTDLKEEIINDPIAKEVSIFHNELKNMIDEQLSKLGEVCKKILLLWSSDYSMEEIMKKMNLVSPAATRKRKHVCLKKLLTLVEENEQLSQQFQDYYYDIYKQ